MFTDRKIKGLRPRETPYREYESGPIPGFCVQVTPAGRRTFYLHYTHDGKRRMMHLGRYPSISLQEARDRAQAARAELDRGNDPMASPGLSQGRQRTGTVRDAVELYIDDMERRGKTSRFEVEANLERHVLPHIGELLARDVRPEHVQEILARVIASGVKRQHNKVRSHLHSALQYALHFDYDPRSKIANVRFGMTHNPVAAVPKDKAAQARTIERNLSFDEVRSVMLFEGWHDLPRAAVWLILSLGGLRPVEVLGAQWHEFNFSDMTFTIPPERFKGRRHHVVAINEPAYAMLTCLMRGRRYSPDYLFPAGRAETLEFHYTTAALDRYLSRKHKAGLWPKGVARFTPYDLRRTFKTRTGEMGIDKALRDRVQGHAISDVSSKHYDRWDYLPEKRQVLETWGDQLTDLLLGQA